MAGSAAASVLAVPFWVVPGGFGDCQRAHRGLGSLAVQSCFPNLAAVTGLRLGSSPCFGSKIANITEIQNLTTTKKLHFLSHLNKLLNGRFYL